MTTRIDKSEALALVLASMCISIISADPELIAKVKAYADDQDSPVKGAAITGFSLELADVAIMMMAKRAIAGRGHAAEAMATHEGHEHQTMVIPVPNLDEGAAQSAGALALGSFAVEFLHKNADILTAFRRWLDENRPDIQAGEYVTQERVEAADQMLTMMAHMADQVAQREGGHVHDPEPEPEKIDLRDLGADRGLRNI
jgi:hypothetical protein